MSHSKETPERKRERLRQEELKRNPIGNASDSFNKAQAGNVSGMKLKELGILIIIGIVVLFIITLF